MFDIPLLIITYPFFKRAKEHPLKTSNKKTRVTLKLIKQPIQSLSLKQRMTLTEISLSWN